MNKYAILDIGTNSIKFFLFAIENGNVSTIIDTVDVTKLGKSLQKTGKILSESADRNIKSLYNFLEIAKDYEVEEITAVGTMCLRSASNAKDFIKRAKNELGLDIAVLSGEEEAQLSYLAASSLIKEGDILIFDTGGGSTEIIFGKEKKLIKKISLNIGATVITEKFLHHNPVTTKELEDMFKYLRISFEKLVDNPDYIVGIGGTATTIASVMYKMKKYNSNMVQGSKITLDEINGQIETYLNKTIGERKKIIGLKPERADIILAGAGIIKSILEHFNKDSFIVSSKGLRHGVMYKKYLKKGRNYAVII